MGGAPTPKLDPMGFDNHSHFTLPPTNMAPHRGSLQEQIDLPGTLQQVPPVSLRMLFVSGDVVLGVDSAFFPTIILFKHQLFLGF